MEQKELYNKLIEAYSDRNLNRITGKLIELYKNKNYRKIREITNKISKFVDIDEENDAKCFSKLVVLYHPDKGESIRKAIEQHFTENDLENLTRYSHIHLLDNFDLIPISTIDINVDYNPEYRWEENNRKCDYTFDPSEEEHEEYLESEEYEKSFYNAFKLRIYGDLNIDFPTHYLEDFEEFEMSFNGIETLDGVEYCKHVVSFDLSNNEIVDISELWELNKLEELFLANNQIGIIDTLSNLTNLRVVDLSGNQIDDISP
ncbi:MAG: leucine-rich repeat domain-containing protein, partial [Saprospiraceae bacterium]|nr:leucine-rich repeat domain-containing protein [Saprospiraceae bacterium]